MVCQLPSPSDEPSLLQRMVGFSEELHALSASFRVPGERLSTRQYNKQRETLFDFCVARLDAVDAEIESLGGEKSAGDAVLTLRAKILNEIARIYKDCEDLESAEQEIVEMLALVDLIKDPTARYFLLWDAGSYYRWTGSPEKAVTYYQRSLIYAAQTKESSAAFVFHTMETVADVWATQESSFQAAEHMYDWCLQIRSQRLDIRLRKYDLLIRSGRKEDVAFVARDKSDQLENRVYRILALGALRRKKQAEKETLSLLEEFPAGQNPTEPEEIRSLRGWFDIG